ncbi:hypothetical protein D5086_030837 [Populus alba]|uniref:Uncharacterized protein n=1 Tax=Populus alba TaxID=43335 RepID=A0ACC4AQB0_POPAL
MPFAVMIKELTCSYHPMSCGYMVLNSNVKQLRGHLGSSYNQFLRRVNKRVLSVVDRIWSNVGCLVDLVDHSDVPLPERPETEFFNFPSFENDL